MCLIVDVLCWSQRRRKEAEEWGGDGTPGPHPPRHPEVPQPHRHSRGSTQHIQPPRKTPGGGAPDVGVRACPAPRGTAPTERRLGGGNPSVKDGVGPGGTWVLGHTWLKPLSLGGAPRVQGAARQEPTAAANDYGQVGSGGIRFGGAMVHPLSRKGLK